MQDCLKYFNLVLGHIVFERHRVMVIFPISIEFVYSLTPIHSVFLKAIYQSRKQCSSNSHNGIERVRVFCPHLQRQGIRQSAFQAAVCYMTIHM